MQTAEHVVQFYETDSFLLRTLTEFIGAALRVGDAGIVVATGEHREDLDARLRAQGLDVAAARTEGRYVTLDAAESLSAFMADGTPDPDRFMEVVGGSVARAAAGGRHVRVFGEMVTLLAQGGTTRGRSAWRRSGTSCSGRCPPPCSAPTRWIGSTARRWWGC